MQIMLQLQLLHQFAEVILGINLEHLSMQKVPTGPSLPINQGMGLRKSPKGIKNSTSVFIRVVLIREPIRKIRPIEELNTLISK